MSSPVSPRSPLYRRTLLSAVFTPLLFTASLVGVMGGWPFWGLLLFVVTIILSISIPFTPAAVPVAVKGPLSEEVVRMDGRIRQFSYFCLYLGVMQLTEARALFERLTNGSLFRWEVLVPAACFTLMVIYRNHRILRELSNEQLATYHRGDGPIRLEGPLFKKKPAPVSAPTPTIPLPPRPDPY